MRSWFRFGDLEPDCLGSYDLCGFGSVNLTLLSLSFLICTMGILFARIIEIVVNNKILSTVSGPQQ